MAVPTRIGFQTADRRQIHERTASAVQSFELAAIPEIPEVTSPVYHDESAAPVAPVMITNHRHVGRQAGAGGHQDDVLVGGHGFKGEVPLDVRVKPQFVPDLQGPETLGEQALVDELDVQLDVVEPAPG